MEIRTATPVEIDTALAEIYTRGDRANAEVAQAAEWLASYAEGVRKLLAGDRRYSSYTPERERELRVKLTNARTAARKIWAETAPYDAEFRRRGGWTRAWLVNNTNGHVHRNSGYGGTSRCATCFPETQFCWLPELSGQPEEQIVAAAGEKACTVCYPTAPVDVLKRKSTIEAPARRAARLEREAKAAERAAKMAAAGIVDVETGGPLRVTWLGTSTETLKTLRTARSWLTDSYEGYTTGTPADIDRVVSAIAAKEGKCAATVIAEAKQRAAKRR
jgi:hypothetical protein